MKMNFTQKKLARLCLLCVKRKFPQATINSIFELHEQRVEFIRILKCQLGGGIDKEVNELVSNVKGK